MPEDAALNAALAETIVATADVQVISFNVKAYGAIGDDSTDDTAEIRAAITAAAAVVNPGGVGGAVVELPPGTYKITGQLTVPGSVKLRGAGMGSTVLKFYGCHGISLGADYGQIEGMQLFSLSAVGVADPKLYDGVTCAGTSGTHVNYIGLNGVFLRGWARCVYAKYAWDCVYDRVFTTNCDKGYVSFGLCGNNAIDNSFIVADTHGLSLILDGANHGEGLNVSGTVIASAAILVYAEQFISLNFDAACILDQGGQAFSLTNCTGTCAAGWIYANGNAITIEALAAETTASYKFLGNAMIWSVTGLCMVIGAKNRNVSLIGATLQYGGASPISVASDAYMNTIRDNTTLTYPGGVIGRLTEGGVSQMDADTSFVDTGKGWEYNTYYFNTARAANRSYTLPPDATSWNGRRRRVVAVAGGGGFTLDVKKPDGTVLATIGAGLAGTVECEYAGLLGTPAWILVP